jgi:hypothetical protein
MPKSQSTFPHDLQPRANSTVLTKSRERECDDFSFCPSLGELAASRRAVGRSGKSFPDLAALSSVNNLIVLRRLMRRYKPARTLEIGLSFGGSCLAFAGSHRELGHPPTRQHMALDPFQQSVWDDCGLLAIEQADLIGYLDFRSTFSSLELPRLLGEGARFGVIYIDGSHLVEDVFVDAYYATRLLNEGGVIAFDDSSDPNIQKVLKFLRSTCRTGLEEINLAPFRADRGATFRYRVARMLGKVQMTAFRRVGNIERAWNAPFRPF